MEIQLKWQLKIPGSLETVSRFPYCLLSILFNFDKIAPNVMAGKV